MTSFFAVMVMIFCAQVNADTIQAVITRSGLSANDQVEWSGFGPQGTDLVSGSQISSQNGIQVTVSEPEYGFQVQSAANWGSAFQIGDSILCNCNAGFPVSFSFSQPLYGAGLQIEPNSAYVGYGYTVYLSAYNGSVLLGTVSEDSFFTGMNEPAPFLGVITDAAQITSITYRIGGQIYNSPYAGDFGVNGMSLTSAPVPEPSSTLLLSSGLLGLLLIRNTSSRRTPSRRPKLPELRSGEMTRKLFATSVLAGFRHLPATDWSGSSVERIASLVSAAYTENRP